MDDAGASAREPRGPWRTLGLALAWACAGVGAGFVLLYAVPEVQMVGSRVAMVAALIPFGVLAWAAALVLFATAARGRGKALALLAVAGLVAQLVWASGYVPGVVQEGDPGAASVMTLNFRCDDYGSAELAEILLENTPGVVVVQGTDPKIRERLDEADVAEAYPYRAFFPMESLPSCGTVVYSRAPVVEVTDPGEQPAVRTQLDGVEILLVPADVPGPHHGVGPWVEALDEIGQVAVAGADLGLPVVVAGDLNAVREHEPFRRLLRDAGLVNAAEAAGAGWVPTYRADRWYPPLLQIDHVLVSPQIEAVRVEAVEVGRSAHRALIAWLRVG